MLCSRHNNRRIPERGPGLKCIVIFNKSPRTVSLSCHFFVNSPIYISPVDSNCLRSRSRRSLFICSSRTCCPLSCSIVTRLVPLCKLH